MKYPFVFIDESGVTDDPNRPQPFYCIGFLKIYDSSKLTKEILQTYTRASSSLRSKRKQLILDLKNNPRILHGEELTWLLASTTHYEYKFSAIRPDNLHLYENFIDVLFKNGFYFCAFVVNRRDVNFNSSVHNDYWDAYLGYVMTTCKCNLDQNEKATVIADYMNKPKSSMKSLENELLSLPTVSNVLRTHSLGTPLLQACDILLGAVTFQHKLNAGVLETNSRNFGAKFELSKKIEEKLYGAYNKKLSGAMTKTYSKDGNNVYFSIFPLKLKK